MKRKGRQTRPKNIKIEVIRTDVLEALAEQRRRDAERNQTRPDQSQQEQPIRSIPGFYYDLVKKRHFPISTKRDIVTLGSSVSLARPGTIMDPTSLTTSSTTKMVKRSMINIALLVLERKWMDVGSVDGAVLPLRLRHRKWVEIGHSREGHPRCLSMSASDVMIGFMGCVLRHRMEGKRVEVVCDVVYETHSSGEEVVSVSGEWVLTSDAGKCWVGRRGERERIKGEWRGLVESEGGVIVYGKGVCMKEGNRWRKVAIGEIMCMESVEEGFVAGGREGKVMMVEGGSWKCENVFKLSSCVKSVDGVKNRVVACDVKGRCMMSERDGEGVWRRMVVMRGEQVISVGCNEECIWCVCKSSVRCMRWMNDEECVCIDGVFELICCKEDVVCVMNDKGVFRVSDESFV